MISTSFTATQFEDNIVGHIPAFDNVLNEARIAESDSVSLIQGETGPGREVIARDIHEQSSLRYGPPIKSKCVAIPCALLTDPRVPHGVSTFEGIIGSSDVLHKLLGQVKRVAPTPSTTLILGETGTGKELIARAIHRLSHRSGSPFIRVNCGAIPESLIASELFGHEKGAFTGATQRRLGRFELADGGTIFLDEVGELPPDTQVALLRVLQEREFERVGGTQPVRVNVRIIAATNRDLKAATADGTFRLDLFYRLNVFPIHVPPLRERKKDICLLLGYFAERYASQMGKKIRSVNKQTIDLLQAYDWPGNIRELQNVVERAVILSSGDVLCVDESWFANEASWSTSRSQAPSFGDENSEERKIIEIALFQSRGRIAGPQGAAAKLKVPRSTLESRIKTLNIRKSRFKFAGAPL